jgi:hypothetical protein
LNRGKNIVKTLKNFLLGFDDFNYGEINERVRKTVDHFKVEN